MIDHLPSQIMQKVQYQIGTSFDQVPRMLNAAQSDSGQRQELTAIAYVAVLNESIKKAMAQGAHFNLETANSELTRKLLGVRDLQQRGDTLRLENSMSSQRGLIAQIGEQLKSISEKKSNATQDMRADSRRNREGQATQNQEKQSISEQMGRMGRR